MYLWLFYVTDPITETLDVGHGTF